MPSTVTVHYPFHPLINRCLKLITWPRHPANAATVEHPDGKTLKIPLWMLQPDAARFHLCERVELSSSALEALVDLLVRHGCSKVMTDKHQEPTHEANHVRVRERRGHSRAKLHRPSI
jgi:hypothetical protein